MSETQFGLGSWGNMGPRPLRLQGWSADEGGTPLQVGSVSFVPGGFLRWISRTFFSY
jgi:hypothetical protein